jgi:hypothetical protein
MVAWAKQTFWPSNKPENITSGLCRVPFTPSGEGKFMAGKTALTYKNHTVAALLAALYHFSLQFSSPHHSQDNEYA